MPVVSVGNLTTGGTGKTPHVVWIAKHFRRRNLQVALISRGYGSESGRNDEAIELESRLPDVPHLQDPDRVRMAEIAVEELESEILVLDDAFQHRRLARDLDIVLIDATQPFGFNRLLPRGLLREPISSLQRADAIVITRVDLVDESSLATILSRIRPYVQNRVVAQTRTAISGLLQSDSCQYNVDTLVGQPVFVFCAIGNPEGFRETIHSIGLNAVESKWFDDHHHFTREDLNNIGNAARTSGAKAIVCTHKDLVKVSTNQIAGIPVYALLIEIEFLSGEQEFRRILDDQIAPTD